LGKDYLAIVKPTPSFDKKAEGERLMYSEDGIHWTEIYSNYTGIGSTAVKTSNYIYIDSSNNGIGKGIRRMSIPRLKTINPLMIQPGINKNWISPEMIMTPGQNTIITKLQKDANGSLITREGKLINDVPIIGDNIYQITFTRNSTSPLVFSAELRNDSTFPPGTYNLKTWIYPIGKTIESDNSEATMIRGRFGSGTKFNNFMKDPKIVTKNNWILYEPTGSFVKESNPFNPVLEVKAQSTILTGNYNYLIAFDSLTTKENFNPYSSEYESQNIPNEVASISGFECKGKPCSIELTGKIAIDSWDAKSFSTTNKNILATFAEDPQNYLSIYADTLNDTLNGEVYLNGTFAGAINLEEIYWNRGSTLKLDAQFNSNNITIKSSVAGSEFKTANFFNQGKSLSPKKIKFSDINETNVSYMLWIDGKIKVA